MRAPGRILRRRRAERHREVDGVKPWSSSRRTLSDDCVHSEFAKVLRSNGEFPDALCDGTGRSARSVCGDVDRRASNAVFNQCGASFAAPEFRLEEDLAEADDRNRVDDPVCRVVTAPIQSSSASGAPRLTSESAFGRLNAPARQSPGGAACVAAVRMPAATPSASASSARRYASTSAS